MRSQKLLNLIYMCGLNFKDGTFVILSTAWRKVGFINPFKCSKNYQALFILIINFQATVAFLFAIRFTLFWSLYSALISKLSLSTGKVGWAPYSFTKSRRYSLLLMKPFPSFSSSKEIWSDSGWDSSPKIPHFDSLIRSQLWRSAPISLENLKQEENGESRGSPFIWEDWTPVRTELLVE